MKLEKLKFSKSHLGNINSICASAKSTAGSGWSVWPNGWIVCSILGHLQQWKFAQVYTRFHKGGSQFCYIFNKPSKNGQIGTKILPKWQNFAQIWSHCGWSTWRGHSATLISTCKCARWRRCRAPSPFRGQGTPAATCVRSFVVNNRIETIRRWQKITNVTLVISLKRAECRRHHLFNLFPEPRSSFRAF